MIEVFLEWWNFWISYWVLTYGVVPATCICTIILFTAICLLGKIWGSSGTSGE